MILHKKYDVIVIGGGHAGCEAAAASARMGASTLLITTRKDAIGEMSCNPAIGGIGKGQIVREIDALDGVMSRVIDLSGIRFRVLNRKKGPAVQGLRSQADRKLYKYYMQQFLYDYNNLSILEAHVDHLLEKNSCVQGVVLENDNVILAQSVVLTTGTFLNGVIHCGTEKIEAGRIGDKSTKNISQIFKKYNLNFGRLKTGTPARLDGKTINWNMLEKQDADEQPEPFSFLTNKITTPSISCGIAYTNLKTHEIIQNNLHHSAVYSGQIAGKGPRYCPSIEDKIVRFSDKIQHQIFLEPEGLDDDTVYPNGLSTSLPKDIQASLIRSIGGLENVYIKQYGYAIEYDYVDPRELLLTLEVKKIKNLFLAGQINGTTGYEEAAGQGGLAGVNAALKSCGKKEFVLSRSQSYIGVMVDDLVLRGVTEPYRMFTSRSEYRLSLRNDNADQRLTPLAISLGMCNIERENLFYEKKNKIDSLKKLLKEKHLTSAEQKELRPQINYDGKKRSCFDLLASDTISISCIMNFIPDEQKAEYSASILNVVETEARYAPYIERQERSVKELVFNENIILPNNIDYDSVAGLSHELREKLKKNRPYNFAQLNLIEGITPSAISSILLVLKKSL